MHYQTDIIKSFIQLDLVFHQIARYHYAFFKIIASLLWNCHYFCNVKNEERFEYTWKYRQIYNQSTNYLIIIS